MLLPRTFSDLLIVRPYLQKDFRRSVTVSLGWVMVGWVRLASRRCALICEAVLELSEATNLDK